jgi:hypothetical protein
MSKFPDIVEFMSRLRFRPRADATQMGRGTQADDLGLHLRQDRAGNWFVADRTGERQSDHLFGVREDAELALTNMRRGRPEMEDGVIIDATDDAALRSQGIDFPSNDFLPPSGGRAPSQFEQVPYRETPRLVVSNAPDGGSAVTGQPLRVTAYRSGVGDSWFSADRRTAATYGDEVRSQQIEMRNPLVVDARGAQYFDIPASVLPAEAQGATAGARGRHATTDTIADWALANGYDGVVIQNVWDGSTARPGAKTDTVYRSFGRATEAPTAGNSATPIDLLRKLYED